MSSVKRARTDPPAQQNASAKDKAKQGYLKKVLEHRELESRLKSCKKECLRCMA